MKLALVIIMLFSSLAYLGQITLSGINHIPQIGDSVSYKIVDNPNFDQGSSGPNQHWDFSSSTGSSYHLKVSSVDDANDSTNHSGSSVVINSTVPTLLTDLFYSYTDSTIIYDGFTTPNGTNEYFIDGRLTMKFPFTYLSMVSDSFHGYIYSNQVHTHNSYGNNEVFGDGFGSLTLPSGQFNNCLRVRTVWNSTWNQINSSNVQIIVDTTYAWYISDSPHPVATYSITNNMGYVSKSFKYSNNIAPNNVRASQLAHINFYPNPVNDKLFFSSPVEKIEIFNLNGTCILNLAGNRDVVNLEEISSGIYILKFTIGSKNRIEKLVIE